jgi:outer membrane protein assembly factor BamB
MLKRAGDHQAWSRTTRGARRKLLPVWTGEGDMKGLIVLVSVGLFATVALGADGQLTWPRFRGPDGSGVADEQKPPVELGPDKNLKWKVPAPSGLSSPIVAGDKLVLTAFEGGKLYTIAYRRADGAVAWRREAPAKQIERYYQAEGSPAASTPATDGKRIVSYFGSCGLVCYNLEGEELWTFAMPPAATSGNFGSGVLPILAEGTVILVRDEMKDPRILALDAARGSLRWEKKRQSAVSYCTPTVWDTPAGKQVVVAGHGRMIGYDLRSGEERWFVSGMPSGPCASPVVADGTLFFAGWSPGGPDDKENQMPLFDVILKQADTNKDGAVSREEAQKIDLKDFFDGFDTNNDGKITRDEWDAVLKFMAEGKNCAFALSPGGTGDVSYSHLLWKQTKGLPYIPSALVYRGQYVMVKDGGLVSAYDAKTGKAIYVQERVAAPGSYYASPVAANGYIYFTSLEGGAVTVLKAGMSKPIVVARNAKLGERVAATPAIADDALYVRADTHLYAFAGKK